jgi:hypothetical protein
MNTSEPQYADIASEQFNLFTAENDLEFAETQPSLGSTH